MLWHIMLKPFAGQSVALMRRIRGQRGSIRSATVPGWLRTATVPVWLAASAMPTRAAAMTRATLSLITSRFCGTNDVVPQPSIAHGVPARRGGVAAAGGKTARCLVNRRRARPPSPGAQPSHSMFRPLHGGLTGQHTARTTSKPQGVVWRGACPARINRETARASRAPRADALSGHHPHCFGPPAFHKPKAGRPRPTPWLKPPDLLVCANARPLLRAPRRRRGRLGQ